MKCFRCKKPFNKGTICPSCGQDNKVYITIMHSSNAYYNRALEKASVRDLTGAVRCLQRSLHLNKENIEARNLLGLIYFELGESVDALRQWVISKNFKSSENRADFYLEEVQKKSGKLEVMGQNAIKYNKALHYARNGSEDLAILQLKKVLTTNPKFVKGYLLIALIYMKGGEYQRAGKALYEVLQIDKNNTNAMRYMAEVKSNVNRGDGKKKRIKNRYSHNEMVNDDVILPPSYKENNGWQTILNILVGLALGAAVIIFIVMPAITKSINNAHTQELIQNSNTINEKQHTISELQNQIAELETAKADIESNLANLTNNSGSVIQQYNLLLTVMEANMLNDLQLAAETYVTIDASLSADPTFQHHYGAMKVIMEDAGWKTLFEAAAKAFQTNNFEAARDLYQKSLLINPADPEALYQLGITFLQLGDKDSANNLFTQIIKDYPTTPQATNAKEQRGY